MDDRRKIEYHEHDTPDEEEFPNLSNVVSANELTGLMYRVPVDGHEMESYQQLYPMEIPRGKQDMEDSVQYKLHHSENAREAGEAVVEASGGEYSPEEPETARKRQ